MEPWSLQQPVLTDSKLPEVKCLKSLLGYLTRNRRENISIIASYANFYDDCTVTQTVYDTELALKIDTITSWTFNFQKSILGH